MPLWCNLEGIYKIFKAPVNFLIQQNFQTFFQKKGQKIFESFKKLNITFQKRITKIGDKIYALAKKENKECCGYSIRHYCKF